MNADDAMIVVVLGDNDVDSSEEETTSYIDIEIKQEVLDDTANASIVEELLQTAEEHGEYLDHENFHFIKKIKEETSDNEVDEELVPDKKSDLFIKKIKEETSVKEVDSDEELVPDKKSVPFIKKIKEETYDNEVDSDEEFDPDEKSDLSTETGSTSDDDYVLKKEKKVKKQVQVKRWWKHKERNSYVAKVREENPHFSDDELVAYLANVLKNIKPPPPPEHNYIVESSMFECVECSALSKTWPAAARHYQNKHGPRYLNCFACGADFRSATNLYKHEMLCISPDAVWVQHARALNQGRVSLNKRECMEKILNLEPSDCKSYVAKVREENPDFNDDQLVEYLAIIMKSTHPPPPPRDYYRVYSLMFECIECSNLSDSLPAATKHYQEKHGLRYLVCFACGGCFRSTLVLYKHEKGCKAPDIELVQKARSLVLRRNSRHRAYVDIPEVKKPRKNYKCDRCPAVFLAARSIKAHMRLHREGRPYTCDQCGLHYTTPSAIFLHRLQHQDKRYICDTCGKEFKSRGGITYHMDSHLPSKYTCPFAGCRRQFTQEVALNIHVSSSHPCPLTPAYVCQICLERYTDTSLLKKHMKDKHGMKRNISIKKVSTPSDREVKQAKTILNEDLGHITSESPVPVIEITVTTQDMEN